MSQLDIPPISLQRYLDLLKRRRWHVIPISLLGLLVGALVAFLIPRYYVAVTTVRYSGSVLEPGQGTPEDPMIGVVSEARLTIPATVRDALDQLGWPDYLAADEETRRAIVAAVESEVRVLDLDVDTRGRNFASLRISYRDTNPDRVAALPNTLRDLWVERQTRRLEDRAETERAQISDRLQAAQQDLQLARQELRRYLETHDIDPEQEKTTGESTERSRLLAQVTQLEQGVREGIAEERRLQAEIDDLTNQLQGMPRVIPDETRVSQSLLTEIRDTEKRIREVTKILLRLKEPHWNWPLRDAELRTLTERLASLEERRRAESLDEGNLVENQRYGTLRAQRSAAGIRLEGVRARLELEREALARLRTRLAELPRIWQGYEELRDRRDLALDRVTTLSDELTVADRAFERIRLQAPIQTLRLAYVPPRPTEPNITLVALAGSAVGLGLAIGLILLIDVARTTFKTLDDVERTLAIPVLGAMAHMETQEQRRETAGKRRYAALVAGAFVVVLVTTVTIYYTDRTRLPEFAARLLDLLLAETS